jgi:Tfp pilus assembly protein PilF
VAYTFLDPTKLARPESLDHVRQAVALDPGSLMAHETLSYALAMRGQKDEAMKEYRTSMAMFQQVPDDFKDAIGGPPQDPSTIQHQ